MGLSKRGRIVMVEETHTLMQKISVLIAGEEVTLTIEEALMAGCFAEDALSCEDAVLGIFFGGTSHGQVKKTLS